MQTHYLFYGQAQSVITNEIHDLIKSLDIDEEGQSFYDASETSFDYIYEDIITPSLFTDKKLIVIRHFEKIYEDSIAQQQLEIFFKSGNDTVTLIMSASHLDENKTFKKVLDLYTEHHEVGLYDEVKMSQMIKLRLDEEGINIEKDALIIFIKRLMIHSDQLVPYLEKLITYALKKKDITLEDIYQLVPIPLEENVYDLVSAFIQDNISEALNMYDDLLFQNEDPNRILQMIGRKLSDLEDAKILIQQRKNQEYIAKTLKISSGRAYYVIKEAKQISMHKVQTYIDQIATLDYQIKSGRMDKKLGVQLFLLGDINHA